jgi:hypothetical protein
MIQLDRATHTYSNNLPSVTQILKSVGLIDTAFYTEEGRARGSAVHLACEYFDQGDLDEDSLDPQIAGYLQGYKDWVAHYGREFTWIELPMQDKTGIYVGTSDRILDRRPRQLWDIKTGPPQKWHKIQGAAYVNMMDDPFSYSRYGLYLRSSGKWKVEEFPKTEYMADLAIFQSALNIYYFKEQK